jgi:DNA-directed RNA polymerase subunit H (RpoH/RPB5)
MIHQTLVEMLNDRGFVLNNDNLIATKDNQIIHIKILDQKKIGKREIINIIEEMNEEEIEHLILVIPQKLTPLALQELKMSNKEIEVFLYKELVFNITKHYTQPKIELLTPKKKKELIKDIKSSQLPIILKSDPIARYYNAKPGMVFKFQRPTIYYRIVV